MKTTGTCSRHRNQRLLVKELLVDGKEIKSGGAASAAWNDISGKPAAFPPIVGTSAETAAAGDHNHSAATVYAEGFLSAIDKKKLDGIADGATKYADTNAVAALKAKPAIVALVPPGADFADLKAATAAVKAIMDALKA